MLRRSLIVAMSIAVGTLSACAPEWGGGGSGTTTTTTIPGTPQTATVVYSGPRGNCDTEVVLVGARVRPCQGLANATTSVIVSSKVLDPWCAGFYGYYPITTVTGTAKQGATTKPLVQTDTTPGTPTFDTGFSVDAGPITVAITSLVVDTSGLSCGWFG